MNNLQSPNRYDRLTASGVTFDGVDRETVEEVLNSITLYDVAEMFDEILDKKFKR